VISWTYPDVPTLPEMQGGRLIDRTDRARSRSHFGRKRGGREEGRARAAANPAAALLERLILWDVHDGGDVSASAGRAAVRGWISTFGAVGERDSFRYRGGSPSNVAAAAIGKLSLWSISI
jgi:hypothetical protein